MPTKFLSSVRPKMFDGKLWYPLLSINFFDTPFFLKPGTDAHEFFRHCETKNFPTGKRDTPVFIHKNFLKPKIFSEILGFSNESFRHRETKKLRRKNLISLLCMKIFDTPNILKHWRDDPEIFRHCETRIFRQKNVIPPSMHKSFRLPHFSETLKECPRNFSALWDKKFLTEFCDTPY